MLSRSEQIEVFRDDIEKLNVQKQELQNMRSKCFLYGDKERLRQEIVKVNYSIQSGEYMIAIFQNERVYDRILTMVSTFVTGNFSELNSEFCIGNFGNYICDKLEIECSGLPFVSKEGSKPSDQFCKDFDSLVDSFFECVNSNKKIKTKILSLVYYNLVVDVAIEGLSKAWSNQYPEFSKISSMETALESYAKQNYKKERFSDKFQFVCWVAQNIEQNISPNALVAVTEKIGPKIDQYILEYKKTEEQARFKEKTVSMIAFLQEEHVYDKVVMIISNFTSENLSELDSEFDIGHFENFISRRSEFVYGSFPFTNKLKYISDDPSFNFCKSFNYLIELICECISNNKQIDKSVLSFVCYKLIVDKAIERLSKAWSDLYPEFSEIASMETALESYAELSSQKGKFSDKFQFACWFVQNIEQNISPNVLVAVIEKIDDYIPVYEKAKEKALFRKKMLAQDDKSNESVEEIATYNTQITIEKIDKFSGIEFERFIGQIFSDDGYEVEYTQTTNDKGIDIIAKRGGRSIGIQCKRYSTSLGVSAIQEVFAGQRFYSLDKAMVITNNYFTKAAIDMAESTDVILWDRDFLNKKIQMMC